MPFSTSDFTSLSSSRALLEIIPSSRAVVALSQGDVTRLGTAKAPRNNGQANASRRIFSSRSRRRGSDRRKRRGDTDVFVVVDFSDNVSTAALSLAANAGEAVHVKATVLFSPEEMD